MAAFYYELWGISAEIDRFENKIWKTLRKEFIMIFLGRILKGTRSEGFNNRSVRAGWQLSV